MSPAEIRESWEKTRSLHSERGSLHRPPSLLLYITFPYDTESSPTDLISCPADQTPFLWLSSTLTDSLSTLTPLPALPPAPRSNPAVMMSLWKNCVMKLCNLTWQPSSVESSQAAGVTIARRPRPHSSPLYFHDAKDFFLFKKNKREKKGSLSHRCRLATASMPPVSLSVSLSPPLSLTQTQSRSSYLSYFFHTIHFKPSHPRWNSSSSSSSSSSSYAPPTSFMFRSEADDAHRLSLSCCQ